MLNTCWEDYSTYFSSVAALYREIKGHKHRKIQMRTALTGGWTVKQVTEGNEKKKKMWP